MNNKRHLRFTERLIADPMRTPREEEIFLNDAATAQLADALGEWIGNQMFGGVPIKKLRPVMADEFLLECWIAGC